MKAFTYQGLPARVVFGSGALASLPAEAERLKLSRLLVLSTPRQRDLAAAVAALLGERAAGIFPEAAMHTPA